MTEREAFEADIREHPDDLAPRLIFADWLDDHGDGERAEFIRAQCGGGVGAATAAKLRTWAGPLAQWCEEYRFRHGFVEEIEVQAQEFLDRAEDIFARAPIRLVRLSYLYSDHLGPLAALPQLASLAVLRAHGTYRHAGFARLCASPHLVGLTGLAVPDTPIGRAGLAGLLAWGPLSRLTHLDLGNAGIGEEGVESLSRSARCKNLLALDLRGNGLGPRALRALERSPHLDGLRRLGLWYNRLGDDGLIELARSPLLRRLRHLSLGNNRLKARGLRALADSPALANLQTLWLGVDRYGAAGVEALTESPFLHPKTKLGFWLNDSLPEQVKERAIDRLGDRVSFDDPTPAWDSDPTVGWPPWRPE